MKNSVLVLISLLAFISCRKKIFPVSNRENEFDKTKTFVQDMGFDLSKVTIDTVTKVSRDSILKFKSAEEAKSYFKQFNKPKRATCLDTLAMLSKVHSKEYYPYLNSLKERAREAMKKPIPGYDFNTSEWQQVPEGYEFLMVLDTIIKPLK
jgi:hypothetical protein